MTSVNYQQYAPYHANYEMSPKPAPTRYEDSAEAQTSPSNQSDPTAPRQSMSTQQRGRFSAHSGMVNSPAPATQTDPGRLEQLSKENKQLRERLEQLVAQFSPLILKLQKQVDDLQEKLDKNGESAKGDSPPAPDASSGCGSSASSEVKAQSENAPVSEPQVPQNFEQISAENKQLHDTVEPLQTQFNTFVTRLQEQIQALNKKLAESGTPPSQVAPQASGAQGSTPSYSSAAANAPDTNNVSSSEESHIDTLLRENEQLRAHLDQIIADFENTRKQLQQQIEALNQSAQAQAGTS
ncbi:hypothetical protein BLL37_02975 [Pseudomonas azotoformans]|uniref:Uncharacterized protein n=1 Tax=Pseudomonas azotoformans TaxID=47878 RepID=A0A1V2JSK2_PSEAZ|nr:hypothetical protein [Pseudomonas azotoformans]OIN49154.1 hypothetical protein BFL39_10590 [Pseudomonas azotoformans]ONH48339.1 hypothetical protein BLL37_02975 [Pseudomonas azotoformans]SDN76273.1 hypothetical protein SAMN04489799_2788 [Pseudomonas azotoformans]